MTNTNFLKKKVCCKQNSSEIQQQSHSYREVAEQADAAVPNTAEKSCGFESRLPELKKGEKMENAKIIRCPICGKNLLEDPKAANVRAYNTVRQKEVVITKFEPCCKGDCDQVLTKEGGRTLWFPLTAFVEEKEIPGLLVEMATQYILEEDAQKKMREIIKTAL